MANKEDKTRFSDSELKEFQELIKSKVAESEEELNDYRNQMKSTEQNKFRGIEDGTGSTEKEYLSKHILRQQKFIKHLKDALIRIENKTYGVCRSTGKLISKQRLMAVPHATLSIEAKNAQ